MEGTIYLRTLCGCAQHFNDREWPPSRVYEVPIFRPFAPLHDADGQQHPPTVTKKRLFDLVEIKAGPLPSAHYLERWEP
jgi:hypothetical protein